MSEFVEVTVRVGDEVVDVHQFGPGEELERESYEMGVQAVGRNAVLTVMGVNTVTQYHDHDTEQQSCDCETRNPPSRWSVLP